MVALSPRFAVLAAFVSLVSLSTSPLLVGAAVIPRAEENANTARFFDSARLQSVFRLSQTKAMRRHDECSRDPCPSLCDHLLRAEILLKRAQPSHLWSVSKQGESYAVSHSLKHSRSHNHPRYIEGREEVRGKEGLVKVLTPEGKELASLVVNEKQNTQQSYPIEALQEKGTTFLLVDDSAGSVTVRASEPGHDVTHDEIHDKTLDWWCMSHRATYLTLVRCDPSEKSQKFDHDAKTGGLSPKADTQQTGSAQSVLSRDGKDQGAPVILRFEPKAKESQDAANAADVSADDPPTATTTKTVTVTNTPAASVSTASTAATGTPNVNASSSSTPTTDRAVPTAAAPSVNASTPVTNAAGPTGGATGTAGTTSTTNGAAPTAGAAGTTGAAGTAGAAGVLEVEVVQASSTPSAIASNDATATTTPTMNPQAIASSIANPSATPVSGTPTNGTLANGTPASGTPSNGTLASGTPASGTPANGTPASGTPANGTPANGTPASGTPANGTPAVASSSWDI